MARIRTIKPEFFTSEDIVSLSPLARLLYIAMWCEADRMGRMQWKPLTFKLRYFPADACDINALCQEIVDRGLVVLYGDRLAYIPSFSNHQHVNPRESASTIEAPPVDKSRVSDASARVTDAQVGKEGKGKERKEGDNASDDAGDKSPVLPDPEKDKTPRALSIADLIEAGASEQSAADWLKVRKAKKAPLTQTALDGLKREAESAGLTFSEAVTICAERGWQSLKAEWLTKAAPNAPNVQTPYGQGGGSRATPDPAQTLQMLDAQKLTDDEKQAAMQKAAQLRQKFKMDQRPTLAQ